MEFIRRARGSPRNLGILAGTFNPPTRAHLALARAALGQVDEVLFVLPRRFPHKGYQGASFEQRLQMLSAAFGPEPRFSIASTEKGLFIDIAAEAHEAYGAGTALHFVSGRDAAERIVNWDYGDPDAMEKQFREYNLLVAARQGVYEPPERFRECVRSLEMPRDYDTVSATEVRERIRRGEPWQDLVPPEIVPLVAEYYR